MNRIHWLFPILLAALAAGCANQGKSFDDGFGESVRHMIRAQTYEPGDEAPPLRGDKAAAAMRGYRREAPGGGGGAMQPMSAP